MLLRTQSMAKWVMPFAGTTSPHKLISFTVSKNWPLVVIIVCIFPLLVRSVFLKSSSGRTCNPTLRTRRCLHGRVFHPGPFLQVRKFDLGNMYRARGSRCVGYYDCTVYVLLLAEEAYWGRSVCNSQKIITFLTLC